MIKCKKYLILAIVFSILAIGINAFIIVHSCLDANLSTESSKGVVEVVEEGGHTLEGRLAGIFDFDGELDFCLACTAQVDNRLERGDQTDAAVCDDGLSEAHLVHAVVDHHLQVVHLDDLVPEVGEQGEGEIAVCNG